MTWHTWSTFLLNSRGHWWKVEKKKVACFTLQSKLYLLQSWYTQKTIYTEVGKLLIVYSQNECTVVLIDQKKKNLNSFESLSTIEKSWLKPCMRELRQFYFLHPSDKRVYWNGFTKTRERETGVCIVILKKKNIGSFGKSTNYIYTKEVFTIHINLNVIIILHR